MKKISMKIIGLLVMLITAQPVLAQTSTKNYLKAYTARQPITGSLKNNANKSQVQQSVQYVDGLGRPLQSVVRWGSPDAKDMIIPFEYDAYGRQIKEYLPYEGSFNDARFNGNAFIDQETFYTNHFGSAADGGQAYSELQMEASPLGRTKKQAAPGDTWKMSGDHTVEMFYRNNTAADAVRQIVTHGSGFSATSNYSSGLLSVGITHDENNGSQEGEVQEFTDKLGRIILMKNKDSVDSYLETYYVYDDYSNLRLVIPPAAVEEIRNSNNWNLLNDEAFQKKWLFTYQYDGRNRMIGKRVPGAEWLYMVYDKRDRLILTQNGNQRFQGSEDIGGIAEVQGYQGTNYHLTGSSSSLRLTEFRFTSAEGKSFHVSATDPVVQKRWIFTKYDELDRPVITGFYYDNDDRDAIQAKADAADDIVEEYTGLGAYQGYGNTAFPNVDPMDLLNVMYYDSYEFTSESIPGGALSSVNGFATGSKTRILGSTDWLTSVSFHDEKYRYIKLVSDNHLGGKDVVENEFYSSISPLVTRATMTHTSSQLTGNMRVIETYTYDHMDRLKSIYQVISENGVLKAMHEAVANEYNALGELSRKTLKTNAQELDYRYNIQGWLTHINEGTVLSGNDRFGLELKYDNAGSHSQYNGNVGTMTWRTAGGTGMNNNAQTFNYAYDPLSRLESASYVSANRNNRFNVSGITYDANGNILTLSRNQEVNGQTKLIDQLTYTYHDRGNQLMRVSDTGDGSGLPTTDPKISKIRDLGFLDGSNPGDDFDYDSNGNLMFDHNKGIKNISYNHLNLPEVVTFNNGDEVEYLYDAEGNKLRKVTVIGNNSSVIDYALGKHYIDGTLSFSQFSEGRIVRNGNLYELEFHLKDHLGNIRVTIDEQGNSVQRDDYYPFGLTFNSWRNTSPSNDYQFNGNETQLEISGVVDFNARFYDASLGRFMMIDPLAEVQSDFTPYHFGYNNPIALVDPNGLIPEDPKLVEIDTYEAFASNINGGGDFNNITKCDTCPEGSEYDFYRDSDETYYYHDGKVSILLSDAVVTDNGEGTNASGKPSEESSGGVSPFYGLAVSALDAGLAAGIAETDMYWKRTFSYSKPLFTHRVTYSQTDFPIDKLGNILKVGRFATEVGGGALTAVGLVMDTHDVATGKISVQRAIFRSIVAGVALAYAPVAVPVTVGGMGAEYMYDKSLEYLIKFGSFKFPLNGWQIMGGFKMN